MLQSKYLEKVKGGERMNSALLKGAIRGKNMTQAAVASEIGISLSRFNAKLNNNRGAEFSLGEIRAIKAILNLSSQQVDHIFFS